MKKHVAFLALSAAVLSLASCSMIQDIMDGDLGEMGDEELPITEEQAKMNMSDLAADGYEIECTIYADSSDQEEESKSTDLRYGGIGDKAWLLTDGTGNGVEIVEGKANYFSFDEEEGWTFSHTIDAEGLEYTLNTAMLDVWLYMGHQYSGSLKKEGIGTVAGRSCDIYHYKMNLIVEKMEFSVYIDQQIGITLKYELAASAAAASAKTGFEITSFKTGNQVTAPVFPPVEEE